MTTTTKRAAGIVALLAAVTVLGGCGHRSVDTAQVGGEPIPGAGALHVFCDRFGTLVYYTKTPGSEDSYEAFFAQACVPGTRPIVSTLQIVPQAAETDDPRWTPDGDLGNTQPGVQEDGQ